MSILLVNGNTLSIPLADKSVQCIVTSPPYWGLRAYSTGDNKHVELGSEPLHDCLGWAGHLESCGVCYICHMRQVARECWRVLRDDGCMFWNIADSYAGSWGNYGARNGVQRQQSEERLDRPGYDEYTGLPPTANVPGLKPKDKCGIPERTALAFQADGWWWRSDIIWHKPNPMPESVTDRPTKSHEFVHGFTKAERYFWDAEAVREIYTKPLDRWGGDQLVANGHSTWDDGTGQQAYRDRNMRPNPAGRNLRDVWTMATAPYSGAHFATFPPALPERCIKAATSERGCCPKCGKPWERVTERIEGNNLEWAQAINTSKKHAALVEDGMRGGGSKLNRGSKEDYYDNAARKNTLGWRPACTCCVECDIMALQPNERRVAHAVQRPGKREGVSSGMEEKEISRERGISRETQSEKQEISESLRSLSNGIYGQENGEVLLEELLNKSDVGEWAGEQIHSIGNEQIPLYQIEEWEDRPGTQASDGGSSWSETSTDREGTSHQRGQGRQSLGEPSCSDDEGTRQNPHEEIIHEFTPYDPVPCIVLDPFSGAATTGIVARELGRHYVGLELSAEYLKQSRDRLSLTALDAWGGNGRKHDADLSDLPMFKV